MHEDFPCPLQILLLQDIESCALPVLLQREGPLHWENLYVLIRGGLLLMCWEPRSKQFRKSPLLS